ncbi:hypothetical protein JOD24_001751 [Kroppenstedtia sanguinis]|uniref:DUF3953 domain-containing protein n=2 Tax=Kroppenstedtia sanguinis TaxID=1380684 RepID=A0ABW4CEW8_9BACL
MTVILIFISALAIKGTLTNKKEGNKPGFYIGGLLTLGTLCVTFLAIYDELIGI